MVDLVKKVCIVGPSGSGKSSIATKYVVGTFSDTTEESIGANFFTKILTIKSDDKNAADDRVKLQIWDTAGHTRFHSIMPLFARAATYILIAVDLSLEQKMCLKNAKEWLKKMQDQLGDECPSIIFVGTKSDLANEHGSLSEKETALRSFAEKNGCDYYTTSAKKNVGLDDIFVAIAKNIIQTAKALASNVTTPVSSSSSSSSNSNSSPEDIITSNANHITPQNLEKKCSSYLQNRGINASPQSIALANVLIEFCGTKANFSEDEKKHLYFLMKPYMQAYGPSNYFSGKEFATKYLNDIYQSIKPKTEKEYDSYYLEHRAEIQSSLILLMKKIVQQYQGNGYEFQSAQSRGLSSALNDNTPDTNQVSTAFNNCVVNRTSNWPFSGPRMKDAMQFLADDNEAKQSITFKP